MRPQQPSDPAGERRRLLDRFYREHFESLLRFLRTRLANPADAEEIAQEAYLRLCRADAAGAIDNLRAFLYRAANNLVVDRYRENRRAPHALDLDFAQAADAHDVQLGAGAAAPDDAATTAQELVALRAAIMDLPPRCRQVFIMHRLQQMTQAQICRELGISHQMVERHLAMAILRCRERLMPLRQDSGTGVRR